MGQRSNIEPELDRFSNRMIVETAFDDTYSLVAVAFIFPIFMTKPLAVIKIAIFTDMKESLLTSPLSYFASAQSPF